MSPFLLIDVPHVVCCIVQERADLTGAIENLSWRSTKIINAWCFPILSISILSIRSSHWKYTWLRTMARWSVVSCDAEWKFFSSQESSYCKVSLAEIPAFPVIRKGPVWVEQSTAKQYRMRVYIPLDLCPFSWILWDLYFVPDDSSASEVGP